MNTICTTTSTRCFAFLGIPLLAVLGCNDSAPKQDAIVQGTVTIDGELVKQGVVTFHPDFGGAVAYGTIHKDGTYALRIGKGRKDDRDNKIFSGKYTATVAVTMPSPFSQGDEGGIRKPGPRLSDAKFSNKATSELKYDVASGRNIINISVGRAQSEVPEEGVEEEKAKTEEDQTSAIEQETEDDGITEDQTRSEEANADAVNGELAQ